jgi:hypothetical protein
MQELSAILNVLTVVLLGVGAFALNLLRTGTEAAAKTGAEEAVKNTIHDLHWPAELAQELQKTRGVERQELRYKSYGGLWKELRPLAIYDATIINKKAMSDLSSKLSNWYFSESGGLLLTPQAREFYFALQDLLRATSGFPDEWNVDRSRVSEGDQRVLFRGVLTKHNAGKQAISVFEYFKTKNFEDWQGKAPGLGTEWRRGIKDVAKAWNVLDEPERFATLQQVGSILRTSLTIDLDSRLH